MSKREPKDPKLPVRRQAVLASLLLTLAGSAVRGQPGTLLLEDGQFTEWTTEARVEGQTVSGAREPSGGNPGAHYRVIHLHRQQDPFSANVASTSFFGGGELDLSVFAPEDVLLVSLDHQAEEDETSLGVATEVGWLPLLRQAGEIRAPREPLRPIQLAETFGSSSLAVPLGSFRPPLDLSAGAPPAEIGFVLESTKAIGVEPKEVRFRMDNFRVLVETPPGEGITFNLTDGSHRWGMDPVIPYQITIENDGPARAGVELTEVVPVNTRFVVGASSAGWSCDPGPDEGGLCTFQVGDLATGERRSAVFAVRVLPGTPEAFEVFNEAGFAMTAGAARGRIPARSHGRCETSWDATGSPKECRISAFVLDIDALEHPVRCRAQKYTSAGPACCLSKVLGSTCDVCQAVCNAPCDEISISH